MMLDKVYGFCKENNIDVTERQIQQMEDFCSFLADKNKVMNLTAISDPTQMEIKHLVDSLTGLPVISGLWEQIREDRDTFRLIDIGCGAGFPGIPLAIMQPGHHFVLLDSLHKRIDFINEAAGMLNLDNVTGVAARAEEYAAKDNRESFDFCVSRAVAEMNVLMEYCIPFVRVGGYCVLYKSSDCDKEIANATNALAILGGQIEEIVKLSLPNGSGDRSLVIIKKISETPAKYPRRPGMPSKRPL